MKQRKGIIVFSGFNQRAVLAFIRTLSNLKMQYAIIAKSPDDTMLLSCYGDAVIAIRNTERLLLEDVLRCVKMVKSQMPWDNYVIAPTSEGLNRFLLKNRQIFEKENIIIPLVNEPLYQKISDKYSFSTLCKINNICVPDEYSDLSNLRLPFVAKPKKYFNAYNEILSPILIFTEEEKSSFLNKYEYDDFYYQEYIAGKSFYLLYYFDRAGGIFKFSQENMAQQSNGKSIVAAVSANIHESELSLVYEEMFKSLGFRGFVMIEVRKCCDEYFMIEANPRFWGPSQLFVDAKKNFFEVFLFDYAVIDEYVNFDMENLQKTRYFWYGGMVQMYKEKKELMYYISDVITEKELSFWLLQDVYMREDSLAIFKDELK